MNANVLVQGLTAGSIYTLVAVGFNVLYRPTNVFNFAHGQTIMYGAMVGAVAVGAWTLPWPLAVLVAVAATSAIGYLVERLAVRPVLRRHGGSETWIITTLAVTLVLTDIAGKIWDDTPRGVPAPPGLSTEKWTVGGLSFSSYDIALVAGTVVLVLVIERLYRTRTGRAVLAVAEDRDAARLRGIEPDRLSARSFIIGGALAGLTGILAAPILYASLALGPLLLIKGFAAATLGGVGNNRGALVAGLTVGVVEAVGADLLSPGFQPAIVFVVMLAVLMVRPQGLTGRVGARTV
ncbi:MAG: hypothetical protein ABS81_02430 [Pseudonocardia sp. SCN 72-86]|nr:MAG: hypothetical protein ABS81_02430 [Pseudonocardia sp. SCN 72-86]